MAFENQPISELRVPDNAGYPRTDGSAGVNPGLVITTNIPQVLADHYGGYPVAAQLYYSDADAMYWYDIVFSSVRIHGYVFNNTEVREFYREPLAADPFADPATFTVPTLSRFQSGATFDTWVQLNGAAYSGPNALPLVRGQVGSTTAGPSATASFTKAVVFPTAFAAGVVPHVTVNLNNGSGPTAQWHARAINVTNTGFTIFGFSGDAGTDTFTAQYTWSAVEEVA